uniref:G-protein coupled receptors family 1 profile domain-containing protein n=1 Tax=Meloidogyne enterolobii TaxID=390850 RepID=A0A6V7TSS6_MELEN|nr:unnamed protein product [Meloidogyne enterolobii]
MNNSSSSTIPQENATTAIRVFGGISYALLSTTSILMNTLLISVLFYGHYQFRRLAFFTLAWQMVFCDLMTQSVQLIIAVPVTLMGQPVYGHPTWYYVILFVDTFAYNATLHFSALMTLNRLCVFFAPRLNTILFSPKNITLTVGALWLYVLGFCSCYNWIGCKKAFSETGFFMYHDCPKQLSTFGIIFRSISFHLSTYLPVLMLIAYLATFVYIRFFFGRQNRVRATTIQSSIRSLARDKEEERIQKARRQREKNFLVQSFLICGFLEIQNLAFDITPAIFASFKGQWSFLVTFAENWISILLNSISPIILFSFNGDVRKCLAELFNYQPQCCFGPQINNQNNNNLPIPFTQSFTVPPSQLLRPMALNRRISDENNIEQINTSERIETSRRQISF